MYGEKEGGDMHFYIRAKRVKDFIHGLKNLELPCNAKRTAQKESTTDNFNMNGLTFKSSSTDSKLFNYLAQYNNQYHGKKSAQ